MRMKQLMSGVIICSSLIINAQTVNNWCGTDKAMQEYGQIHPEYFEGVRQLEENIQMELSNPHKTAALTVYYIPVVFHILHQNGAENISDAQIYDAVKVINEDFRKKNADTNKTIAAFRGIAADCAIEVRLATKDPTGACTKGIIRYNTALTNDGSAKSKINQWAPTKYLNIWVVKNINGAAGYALFPGFGSQAEDGIVILHDYVGSIGTGSQSRKHALPHEVGHYLGLYHTWGFNNTPGTQCGDDFVGDTPDTKGSTTCNLNLSSCTVGVVENVQNFMEYSYCSTMFTAGQRDRMRATLQSGTWSRPNLWTAQNQAATGISGTPSLCAADFAPSADTVCAGSNVVYSDLSWNGTPTSWSWSFPGGTPATSTETSPTIVYSAAGTYTASLTVSNSTGTKTLSKKSIFVRQAIGNKYTQDFEGYSFPGPDFLLDNKNATSVTWQNKTGAGSSGNSCIYINNMTNTSGHIDEFTTPGVNLAAITNPEVSFKIAYIQKTSTDNDRIQVFASTDCGKTWVQRYSKFGAGLATAAASTNAFTPASSGEWRKDVIPLNTSFTSKSNVMFRFRFTSGGGNNVYIDDINISSLTGIDDEFGSRLGFNVYPNPMEDNAIISFTLNEKKNITLKVYDMLGRDVVTLENKELVSGDYSYPVSTSAQHLQKGVYFVRLTLDNDKGYVRKIVIQ